jgi:soluble lytic murein transglycosylase-like protein
MTAARVLLLVALPIAGAVAWVAVRERPRPTPATADEPAQLVEVAAVKPDELPALLQQFGAAIASSVDRVSRLFTPPASAAPYVETIAAAEQRYGLPQSLLARVLYQESRYRPDIIQGRTRSSAGAVGIAQFMPATARDLGVDPLNPTSAIDGAGKYLRQLYDALGSWEKALAAYNWGVGNVTRKGMPAAPTETQNYIREILADVDVA